ncbi:MAG: hypothetical protein LBR28_06380 [Bacteroidales bacterium]|jgi:hypothetical protein|nr:hypothetical protein [Bacteroidales bacterium]
MKKTYLFPTGFEKVGWIITILSVVWIILNGILGTIEISMVLPALIYGGNFSAPSEGLIKIGEDVYLLGLAKTDFNATLFPVIFITGMLFVGFAKQKIEDEMISHLRQRSLVWSIIVSYSFYALITLLVYGHYFLYAYVYGIYLFLIFFIIKFKIDLFRLKREVCKCKDNEEINDEYGDTDCCCKNCDCV